MRTALSHSELETLEAIAKRDQSGALARNHLEKLSRLDLIEPCEQGVCMTPLGQQILVKSK